VVLADIIDGAIHYALHSIGKLTPLCFVVALLSGSVVRFVVQKRCVISGALTSYLISLLMSTVIICSSFGVYCASLTPFGSVIFGHPGKDMLFCLKS